MLARFRNRYLDLLGSIYIYNEHRGYTALDRVLQAVRARSPDDHIFIGLIETAPGVTAEEVRSKTTANYAE